MITHNSEDVVQACLKSLAEQAPEAEVIVVDNASADRTVERSAGFRVIANRENRGFAGAANQGFRAARGNLILLLNPDAQIRTPLNALIEACEEHGVAGGRLSDPEGSAQAGFTIRRFPTAGVLILELLGLNRLFPENPLNRSYRYLDRDLSKPGPADQPAGAFLMVRKDVWEQLGGFDESFHPVWFEDVDFCYRAAAAGYPAWYVPSVRATHSGGHSIKKLPASRREVHWYDSLLKYARKHFRPWKFRAVCVAAMSSAIPRAFVGMVRERELRSVVTWLSVFNLSGKHLVSRRGLTELRSGSEKKKS